MITASVNLKPWKMFHFNSSTRKMALFSEFPKTREALFTCFWFSQAVLIRRVQYEDVLLIFLNLCCWFLQLHFSNSSANAFNSHLKLLYTWDVGWTKKHNQRCWSLAFHSKNGIQPKLAFQCLHYAFFLKIFLIKEQQTTDSVTSTITLWLSLF